jgi:hypothetical protein
MEKRMGTLRKRKTCAGLRFPSAHVLHGLSFVVRLHDHWCGLHEHSSNVEAQHISASKTPNF